MGGRCGGHPRNLIKFLGAKLLRVEVSSQKADLEEGTVPLGLPACACYIRSTLCCFVELFQEQGLYTSEAIEENLVRRILQSTEYIYRIRILND